MTDVDVRIVIEDGRRLRKTYYNGVIYRIEVWDGFRWREPMELLNDRVALPTPPEQDS